MSNIDVNKQYLWERKEDSFGSSLYIPALGKNRRIKRKQKVKASIAQLGTKIDQFTPLEGQQVPDISQEYTEVKSAPVPPSNETATTPDTYHVVHIGTGWYNVLSAGGKVMNDKKLRSEEANNLKTALEDNSVELKDVQ
jgi:hypothetical protein